MNKICVPSAFVPYQGKDIKVAEPIIGVYRTPSNLKEDLAAMLMGEFILSAAYGGKVNTMREILCKDSKKTDDDCMGTDPVELFFDQTPGIPRPMTDSVLIPYGEDPGTPEDEDQWLADYIKGMDKEY